MVDQLNVDQTDFTYLPAKLRITRVSFLEEGALRKKNKK